MTKPWSFRLGAHPEQQGTSFRVWAPKANTVELIVERNGASLGQWSLTKTTDGYFGASFPEVRSGDRYRYRLDGEGPYPDPTSRHQPEGVHGPSEVVASNSFAWTDANWRGLPREQAVFYELHVGTFTPAGTFLAATERLAELAELGVTAIELMPIADFPGRWNWGYDGVCLFAPARCYGRPDDLRHLVNEAHRLGLAVILDVVYNHFGPDGNYLRPFSPYYFTSRHKTPWGDAINFDGEHSAEVRRFFLENALYWLQDFHFDGLRLDATHAIIDDSETPFLQELQQVVREELPHRDVLLIAEDHRNLATMVQPPEKGGWGLDGVWADDFHHQVRRLIAGDQEGYYRDYTGSVADLAETIQKGWYYCGQYSGNLQENRGTDPGPVPPAAFVICIQNHDQIGNRAKGERLNHHIELAAYQVASTLVLVAPQTPLLFMGQEWGASAPFLYFTDHNEELGRLITQGRRKEFQHFSAFSDPQAQLTIPDPQDESTFRASVLDWSERSQEPQASLHRLYQRLLTLRRTEPALRSRNRSDYAVEVVDDSSLILRRNSPEGPAILAVFRFGGPGQLDLTGLTMAQPRPGQSWEALFSSCDPIWNSSAKPTEIERTSGRFLLHFRQPAAILFGESALATINTEASRI